MCSSKSTQYYAELHCHSNFSMLDGASSPAALVERALELGMTHLALTDHDGLYGAVRFHTAARARGLVPIIGLEVGLVGPSGAETQQGGHGEPPLRGGSRGQGAGEAGIRNHLTLLARDLSGYHSLCRLVSRGQLQGAKHAPVFTDADLALHAEGLIALSGCRDGEVARRVLEGDFAAARAAAARLAALYGKDNFYIELQDHLTPDERPLCVELASLADELGLPVVTTNNVHYAERDGHRLQDVLTCIRHNTTLDLSAGLRKPNSEYHLKSPEEMAALFSWRPDAVANSVEIAARCNVEFSFSKHRHPRYPLPGGHTERSYLHKLALDGAINRYGSLRPDVLAGLRHELDVIHKLGLENFFIVVWDIMRYAREHNIPVQGRGSAADSIVAYVLGITRVDPIRHNLLFERFLNEERAGMPDIDIDVSTNHREELIGYVYEKYSQEHTAMVATVITYRARSAVRDVGKALGFPPEVLDTVATSFDSYSRADRVREEVEAGLGGRPPENLPWGQLLEMCEAISGFPRHLSIHVGGMLITEGPLVDVAPLEHATAPGRVVTQYDKDDIEDLGLIKIDLLGLRTLSLVSEVLDEIETHTGERPDLDRLREDDADVYDMLCRADSIGVFQVESRAQSQTLPKMLPRKLDDLVVEVAIIRPGPLQGNMVHPYLRRRQGLELVEYLHPSLEPILGETLGVCIFQEQVMKIATDVAGFRPGEADLFRRAMGSHHSHDEMEKIRSRFISGCSYKGLDEAQASELFRQLAGFASFGFCKSHAAAFARTTYETAWLKLHYPAAFYAALLNNQPMGFYSPEVIIGDACRHGIRILRPDINRSGSRCTVEDGHVRLGLAYVRDLGERALERIETERARNGPFRGFEDFCKRVGTGSARGNQTSRRGAAHHRVETLCTTPPAPSRRDASPGPKHTSTPSTPPLNRDSLESLIFAGAFDNFSRPRRRLLWELNRLVPEQKHKPAGVAHRVARPEPLDLAYEWNEPDLQPMSAYERVAEEYGLMGLSPAHHLLEFHRAALEREGVVTAADLSDMRGGYVRVAGMVVCRQQPPTAKGHVFLTIEDETGLINVILRPQVYERYRAHVRRSPLLVIDGRLDTESGIQNVLATSVEPWRELPSPAPHAPRGIARNPAC